MRKKKIFTLLALILCGILVFGNTFQIIQAEDGTEVPSTDTITFTPEKDGDSLVLHLNGYLPQNWWYTQQRITVTYSDGTAGEIEIAASPGNHTISAQYNWGTTYNGTMTSDESVRSFDGTVSIPAAILNSTDFTMSYDGSTYTSEDLGFTNEAESASSPSEETAPSETASAEETQSTALSANANGKITVDGSYDDWNQISEQASGDSEISWWKAARDTDGNLYLVFTGPSPTQWYGNYSWKYLSLKQNGIETGFQITNNQGTTGGQISVVNNANGNSAADYIVELSIPASYITDPDFTLTFTNTTLNAVDIPVVNGTDVTPAEDNTYHGITIDGTFKDWNGVTKYDAACPNTEHPNCLSQAAMVFDGDKVYIYVKEGEGGSAANAGSHSNGNFEILTDLGNRAVLHFNSDGTVTSESISNIQSSHVGSEWEVSLDASQLPAYTKTISFGLYQADDSDPEPFVKGIANLNGTSNEVNNGSNIVYDGQYDDWSNYPHTLIEYATSGTQTELPDGEGAIYSNGTQVLGHVYTEMSAHLNEHGGELAYAISIRLNRNEDTIFYPRLVTIDSAGNINWNPSFQSDGTYEYYILDNSGWSSAKTLDDLNSGNYHNSVYGKMTMTINNGSRDECEYYLDIDKLAEKFNLDPNDIQYIEEQFGRIGQQWIGTSGASSGPWANAAMCAMLAGLGWVFARKHAIG